MQKLHIGGIAVAVLRREFYVGGGRYYQLGEEHPATVIFALLDETLRAFPAALLAALVVEAFRGLLP